MTHQRLSVHDIDPKAYEAILAMERYVRTSGLDKPLYELIKIRASQLNGCGPYRPQHVAAARPVPTASRQRCASNWTAGAVKSWLLDMSTRAEPSEFPRPRVAIVGARPPDISTADALLHQEAVPVAVDLIDRLPTPLGLVRYGVAPDRPDMRGLRESPGKMLQQLDGWRAVDAAEVALGATRGRADTILHERRTLPATAEAADARADVNSAPVSATNLAGSGSRNE